VRWNDLELLLWGIFHPVNQFADNTCAVAELQGLYGAFSFPEHLLQKIWLRGDFDRAAARTSEGRSVRILHPGRWNRLGGPDFLGARLRFADGPEVTGDIEIHLRPQDWEAHGHARDRAYEGVILHVVLFCSEGDGPTLGVAGRRIPVLGLLPLLHQALEEFAAEEAVEVLTNRETLRLPNELGILPFEELLVLLQRHAVARWRQKVYFARLRVQRLGWVAACHHAALEILGYRFNRAPMLRVAARWPLPAWRGREELVDQIYEAEAGSWSLQGVRPANHPRRRLRQYASWSQRCGDWPDRLGQFSDQIPVVDAAAPTREVRCRGRFARLRRDLTLQLGADGVAATRMDTLICDGFLPLLAVASGDRLYGTWYHWPVGDIPSLLGQGLRQLGVFNGRICPASHGAAQGLLGWLIDRAAEGP